VDNKTLNPSMLKSGPDSSCMFNWQENEAYFTSTFIQTCWDSRTWFSNFNNTYYIGILLTPWCRILFEKLIVTKLVKNIPLSYGNRMFITVFTEARNWNLS
jgi:hypothetical protein